MKISTNQYAQALFELLKQKKEPQESQVIIDNFVAILIKNNDAYKLEKIISNFKELWNKEFLVVQAEINSFYELDVATEKILLDYIKKMSNAKTVELEKIINKDILGGVVIKYSDKIFDASLKTSLIKLKETLLK